MNRLSTILIVVLLAISRIGDSQEIQDSLKVFRIETSDGNEYIGSILETDSLLTCPF